MKVELKTWYKTRGHGQFIARQHMRRDASAVRPDRNQRGGWLGDQGEYIGGTSMSKWEVAQRPPTTLKAMPRSMKIGKGTRKERTRTSRHLERAARTDA